MGSWTRYFFSFTDKFLWWLLQLLLFFSSFFAGAAAPRESVPLKYAVTWRIRRRVTANNILSVHKSCNYGLNYLFPIIVEVATAGHQEAEGEEEEREEDHPRVS